MVEENILAKFRSAGITRGDELYVLPFLGSRMAEAAAESGIAVVGVDAAILRDHATIPQPDLTADFSSLPRRSWAAYVEDCRRECLTHIRELPDRPDLYVSLVMQGEHES